jgi:hypothetical protein
MAERALPFKSDPHQAANALTQITIDATVMDFVRPSFRYVISPTPQWPTEPNTNSGTEKKQCKLFKKRKSV